MNFSFDLFGFDFIPDYKTYGVWLGFVQDSYDEKRCLFCLHYSECDGFRFEMFWVRLK